MSLFKQNQVYSSVRESNAWNEMKGEHTVRIVTFIFERRFWKFHFYRVKQFIPLIAKPFYDGEFASNRSVKADAAEEKAKAYEWIYNKSKIRNEYENNKIQKKRSI